MQPTAPGDVTRKPATAARIYDYLLGGVHNFPADQQAAREIISRYPDAPAAMGANRAFLRRGVRYLVEQGIDQFLDLGSGIPTEGNVHEVAQGRAPGVRVVYVDIDPVAVAESMELLEGNPRAVAIRADMRDTEAILGHRRVAELLDLTRPVGLLLASVLHFLPDDEQAYGLVERLVSVLAPGSFLLLSHGAAELPADAEQVDRMKDLYQRQTSTATGPRTREQVARFFAGLDLVEPGLVWVPQWRPDPGHDHTDPLVLAPQRSGMWCGVGRRP